MFERFVCARAWNLPICEQWCKDTQNMRPNSYENVNLGVDYKVSEVDIKWFLINSVVKLAMFVKKL